MKMDIDVAWWIFFVFECVEDPKNYRGSKEGKNIEADIINYTHLKQGFLNVLPFVNTIVFFYLISLLTFFDT